MLSVYDKDGDGPLLMMRAKPLGVYCWASELGYIVLTTLEKQPWISRSSATRKKMTKELPDCVIIPTGAARFRNFNA